MRNRLLAKLIPLALLLAARARAGRAARTTTGAASTAPTDDKVVTNAGFILIVFFPLFVFTMSMLQRTLEKRKEARKAAQKQLGDAHWRGGW